MSGPFSSVPNNGQPVWSTISPQNGNFANIQVGGIASISEVGYGEGGYGQDGYDAPEVNLPSAPTPIWTVETVR